MRYRIPLVGLATGLFGFLAFWLFGLFEAWFRLEHDGGVALGDLPRAGAAAFVLGLIPMTCVGLLSAWLAQTRSSVARILAFWSVPVLGTATIVIGALVVRPDLVHVAILAVVAQAVIAYLARRRGMGLAPPIFCAPFCWAMALATVVLLRMQYADLRWQLNGIPSLLVAAPLVATFSSLVGLARFSLTRRERGGPPRATLPVFLLLVGGLVAASFFVLRSNRGDYLHLQLLVLYVLTLGGLGLLGDRLGVILQRVRHGPAVAVGVVAVGVGLAVWTPFRDVDARFGLLSVDSQVGLAAHLLSMAQDQDGDGFYPTSVGGNDCDDRCRRRHTLCDDRSLPKAAPLAPTLSQPVRHVIVLLVDALHRGDLAAGIRTKRYPFLSRQAGLASRFTRAYAPGNTTRLSVVPMLTGISPTYFLETRRAAPIDTLKRLWIVNQPSGVFLCKLLIFSEFSWMHQAGQLFADPNITESHRERTASGYTSPLMAERIIDIVRALPEQRRLLLVGFTTDPHARYQCRDGSTGGIRCYRDEIRVVDSQLSRIFDALRARGLLEQTMVIVTSDHGEELGDHGHFGEHGTSLYEEQIRVPLFIWHPGIAPRVIDTPVSLMGLLATIADAAHLPVRRPLVYPSLLPLATGRARKVPPPMVQHWTGFFVRLPVRTTAMISGNLKLVYDWRTTASRLYEVGHSPEKRLTGRHRIRDLTRRLRTLQHHADRLSRQAHRSP